MRTDCRICRGKDLRLILKLSPTPIGDEFLLVPKDQPFHPIDLYQCQDCGLAQLLYEIPPEEIYRDYLYLTGSSVGLDEHFRDYANEASKGLTVGDLVVDIGSNDGTLLKHFKSLGMDVVGFEPCEPIADIARASGIPTIAAYFGKMEYIVNAKGYHVKPKLITANNVVANVNDLDSFMEGVVSLLAPDGTFVFESFYLGDVVKNMVFDFIYHEHLSAFSVKSVKRLMARYGLRLYKVEHVKTKGGSIRYYCNRYYAGHGPEVPDDDPQLYTQDTYDAFTKKINGLRDETVAFLRQAKAEGKTVAGFGASISCTTLLHHFQLSDYLCALVDDNPAKQGRYMPGTKLQVAAVETLYDLNPDYVLCLAWRFSKDFKQKHPQFKTITPLPQFTLEV